MVPPSEFQGVHGNPPPIGIRPVKLRHNSFQKLQCNAAIQTKCIKQGVSKYLFASSNRTELNKRHNHHRSQLGFAPKKFGNSKISHDFGSFRSRRFREISVDEFFKTSQ